MSFWEVLVQAIAVQSSASRQYVPMENDMPNVFGIADNILVIDYDKDSSDHDEAVYDVVSEVPRCQPKTK